MSKKISVLKDRASFMFPENAEFKVKDVYGKPFDTLDEGMTRIEIKTDSLYLFIAVREEWFAGDNMEISDEDKKRYSENSLDVRAPLSAIVLTPKKLNKNSNSVFTSKTLIRLEDNSVLSISTYIQEKDLKLLDSYKRLCARIFSTVEQGSQRIDLSERTEQYILPNSGKKLLIEVPRNYKSKEYIKDGLKRWTFAKYTSPADEHWASITLRFAPKSTYHYLDENLLREDGKTLKGKFLSEDVDWISIYEWTHSVYIKEQIVYLKNFSPSMCIHVIMLSTSPLYIEELTGIVERIKLVVQ